MKVGRPETREWYASRARVHDPSSGLGAPYRARAKQGKLVWQPRGNQEVTPLPEARGKRGLVELRGANLRLGVARGPLLLKDTTKGKAIWVA